MIVITWTRITACINMKLKIKSTFNHPWCDTDRQKQQHHTPPVSHDMETKYSTILEKDQTQSYKVYWYWKIHWCLYYKWTDKLRCKKNQSSDWSWTRKSCWDKSSYKTKITVTDFITSDYTLTLLYHSECFEKIFEQQYFLHECSTRFNLILVWVP